MFLTGESGLDATMALLARSTPKFSTLHAGPLASVARVDRCVEARLGDTMLVALPDGALWVEAARALVVSDLHLEKASAFARSGQMLPPYDTRATLERLRSAMDEHEPDIVISLGDAFHDGGGPARLGEGERELLRSLMARADWVWVEGNHDARSVETLGGVVVGALSLGSLLLRHEPSGAGNEISGHLHPCARVAGRGTSVRRRCFAYDGERLVMPAYGALVGGLNVRDDAFVPIFPDGVTALVVGRERVAPAPWRRLMPD